MQRRKEALSGKNDSRVQSALKKPVWLEPNEQRTAGRRQKTRDQTLQMSCLDLILGVIGGC